MHFFVRRLFVFDIVNVHLLVQSEVYFANLSERGYFPTHNAAAALQTDRSATHCNLIISQIIPAHCGTVYIVEAVNYTCALCTVYDSRGSQLYLRTVYTVQCTIVEAVDYT